MVDSDLLSILNQVKDPEIPVLSIIDLGIVKAAKMVDISTAEVSITPTYTGCPAMDTVKMDLIEVFAKLGIIVTVKQVLDPAWSTDDITEEGLANLKAYGIAPPLGVSLDKGALIHGESIVPCPRCQSTNTIILSQFGSTACKALFKCQQCYEPFDYFKCHK